MVLELGEEHGANDGDAERATELLCGGEDPAGAAGDLARDGGEHDIDERDDEQRESDTGDAESGNDWLGIGGVPGVWRADEYAQRPYRHQYPAAGEDHSTVTLRERHRSGRQREAAERESERGQARPERGEAHPDPGSRRRRSRRTPAVPPRKREHSS